MTVTLAGVFNKNGHGGGKSQNPDIVKWRSWRVKRNTRFFSTREGAQRRREDEMNEHFFYSCIYGILKDPKLPEKKTAKLNLFKAMMLRIYGKQVQTLTKTVGDGEIIQNGRPSFSFSAGSHKEEVPFDYAGV